MGMNKVTLPVFIRRYDRLQSEDDELQTYMQQVSLASDSTYDDLKVTLFSLVDLEDDGSRVLKIRRHDNKLVPITSLLHDSPTHEPFIVDVVRVHQFCPTAERTISADYVDAFQLKLKSLEKRVRLAEREVPELNSVSISAVEETVTQLGNCISFLDRRLDELIPPHWKERIESGIQ